MNQELTQTSLVDLSMIDFTFNTGNAVRKFICSELRIKKIVETVRGAVEVL